MSSPFTFQGRIGRLPYALWSLGIFFSQHLAVLAVSAAQGRQMTADWGFYLMPLRALVTLERPSSLLLIAALAYLLIAAWALAALAFRRAADADLGGGIAVFAIAPILQIPAILFLCLLPPRPAQGNSPVIDAGWRDGEPVPRHEWAAAAQGVVAGMALTLIAVAMGALVFHVYGFGMFVVSPFVIGAATGYLANRKTDLGGARTALLVVSAAALGCIALVMVALEGIVCIVMASPLGLGVAFIGGALGRAIALSTRRSPAQTLPALALLPLVFALESALPATTSFDTDQTIVVHASPEAVWQAIVQMERLDAPQALPFRLGVAYPLGGEIIGEGVGATRRGEFSTGTALERVTEWVPNRKLAFVVLTDVPAMHELSPYRHVHAPHLVGYFRTTATSFELSRRSDGVTEIVERTSHELKLDPVLYWLPLARWVVSRNNSRVLDHIRRQAERSVRSANEFRQ
jgi:uncharacterized membrane protein YhaH (DUF805 family)